MKIAVYLFLFHLLAFAYPVTGQERYFNITSFTIDGRPADKYSVKFRVGEKVITPTRKGDRIVVPDEVSNADDVLIILRSGRFAFEQTLRPGYTDADEVKTDVKIDIDTPPFGPQNRSLPFANYCVVYSITGVPRVVPGTDKVVDPNTATTVQQCP